MEKDSIFRKKSLDRIASPEELNDYVKATNTPIWIILSSVLILILGACCWGIFGRVSTKIETCARVNDGKMIIYIKEQDRENVKEGMALEVEGKKYKLPEISKEAIEMEEDKDSFLMHLGQFVPGDWAYTAEMESDLEEGTYDADIIVEEIAPIKFITD